jgi:hypothetical protein
MVVRSADQAVTRCRDSIRAPQAPRRASGQIKLQTRLSDPPLPSATSKDRLDRSELHGSPVHLGDRNAHGVPIKVFAVARMCAEAISEGLTSVPVGCVSWPDVHQSAASDRPASKALVSSHPSRPGSSRRRSTGVRSRCQAGASVQWLRRGAIALNRSKGL